MKIAAVKEQNANEKRVAVTPDTVKRFAKKGFEVHIEKGAGEAAGYTDEAYKDAGAKIAASASSAIKGAAFVLTVQPFSEAQAKELSSKQVVIGCGDPFNNQSGIKALAKKKATFFAMELVPRITRAQSMDILSSQANLAGYRAVIDAVHAFGQAFPMMMTAAGTVAPAKVFVMGAGVAGLQAIATAKRLGAVVSATDVRAAAREQVESLGASFVMVENEETKEAETAGGYAKEMSDEYKKQQAELIAETIAKQDVVITTALIPGRPAPELVTEEMVKSMKPGSVIVDLAAANGGNCKLTKADSVTEKHGVTLIGYTNLPSRVAKDSSQMYARNLYNFIETLVKVSEDGKSFEFDWNDEIVKSSALLKEGEMVNERFKQSNSSGKKTTKKAPKKASKKTAKKSTKAKTTKKKSSSSKKTATKKSK